MELILNGTKNQPRPPGVAAFLFLIGLLSSIHEPVNAQEYKSHFAFSSSFDLVDAKKDASGNTYIIGQFSGTIDIDPGAGYVGVSSEAHWDNNLVVIKLDASGNYQWGHAIGGDGDDKATALALHGSNVYITGFFGNHSSTGGLDFDPSGGENILTSFGAKDIFVWILDSNGGHIYARNFGGSGNDTGDAIDTDASGNIFVHGFFQGTADFQNHNGSSNLTSNGNSDVFTMKMDMNGNYQWVKNWGTDQTNGSLDDKSGKLAVDTQGNVISVVESFRQIDMDPGAGVDIPNVWRGGFDLYVIKLDTDGNYVWGQDIGGTNYEELQGLITDENNNIILLGEFRGTIDLDFGAGTDEVTAASSSAFFVTKMSSSGSYVWSSTLGENFRFQDFGLASDKHNNVYVSGMFDDSPFKLTDKSKATVSEFTSSNGFDGFLHKLDADGNHFYSLQLKGDGDQRVDAVIVEDNLDLTFLGQFSGDTDVDASSNTVTQSGSGVLVATYEQDVYFTSASSISFAENQSTSQTIINVLAKDMQAPALNEVANYSITGGTDQSLFKVDHVSGLLTFNSGRDFENPEDNGSNNNYEVEVTATNGGKSNSQLITVTITDENDAPGLSSIGNQTIDEASNLTFTASATDADLPANTLTYSLDMTSVSAGMTINSSTGVFNWTPSEAQSGTHSVTVTVSDGSLNDSETFIISVGEVNVAPVLSTIGNHSVDEGKTLTFSASATDADLPANTLTYGLDMTSVSMGMTINASTGVFSWTPSEAQNGTHSVKVTVSDGSLNDSETIMITVGEVNEAPVLAIGNQTINEGSTLTFTASATDADLPANTLTYSLDMTSVSVGMTINASTAAFSWTPGEAQSGTHSVTITVSDGSLNDSETFIITVGEVNVAPVLSTIGNQSVDESNTLTFTASATDIDLPANTLTYSLDMTSLSEGMTIDASTGAFSWKPGEAQSGTHSVTITVSDGSLNDSETLIITVGEVNVAPVLSTIGNQSVDEGNTLTFTASATDADLPANTLTYNLDMTSVSVGMTIDASTGAFSWTPGEAQSGTHSVTITVSDGSLNDSETLIITVGEVNVAPVLSTIGNHLVDEGNTLTFTASATDIDLPANTLTYSLDMTSVSAGMTIDDSTGAISWTPGEAQSGTHSVTVTVSDGSLNDSETFIITVGEVNVAPVLSTIGNHSVDEGNTLTFTASATDVDLPANTLTYSLDAISEAQGMVIDTSTGVFSWVPGEAQDGIHAVTLTISDGFLTDKVTITITVNEVNVAPSIISLDDQVTDTGEAITFVVEAMDTDLPANTLTFSIDASSVEKGMSIDHATGSFSWSPESSHQGIHELVVSVSDGSLSVSQTIKVSVSVPLNISNYSRRVEMYPNPAVDQLNIIGLDRDVKIKVLDVRGKQHAVPIHWFGGDHATLKVKGINAGLYWIQITSSNEVKYLKLLKND